MNEYKITDNVHPLPDEVQLGDQVTLKNQTQEVVACQETGVKMLNIDADQLALGDLSYIKKLGLTISNPDTDKPVALGVDYVDDSFGHRLNTFLTGAALGVGAALASDDDDDDDDSSFFHSSSSSSSGSFGGGSSFGGFGGGSFSGGGASSSF